MFNRQSRRRSIWLAPILLLVGMAGHALADPPSRVARLSYLSGDVSMQPAGLDEWSQANLNRPLITGDTLYTDRASRVELEVGAATARLDERTSFRLLNLDDATAQIELTSGSLNLNVRNVFEGQTYEIDTPTLALVIDRPGKYRIDIAPEGDSTMVSVVEGNGEVYGRDNASYRVRAGESYRFYDSQLEDYEVLDLPRQDDFDRWCFERIERYERSPSRRYVSEEVIGYADLDDYGSWSSAPSYGSIWYPSRVDSGWTPYRDGHWAWIDPWGWTWVDDAPWGFAPSHYGRWAYVGSRWGWVPGPRNVRPIYAPALVAFVGGGGFSVTVSSGGPVGWFPLGPRDVYVPWYRGSRNYFNNINVRNTTIINNTYITNVYNDYSNGRPVSNFDYAYRNNRNAYTSVSHDTFINARSVNRARLQVSQAQLSQGRVVSRIEVAPTARSFAGGNTERRNGRGGSAATFDRQVIARTAPPVRGLDAQERIRAISRNNNQPLAAAEMRQLSTREARPADRTPQRVQVVGGGRPSATTTPTRAGADAGIDAGTRVRRQDAAGVPTRNRSDEAGVRNNAPVQRGRSDNEPTTVRAPRSNPTERVSPAARERQPAIERAPSRGSDATRPSIDDGRTPRGVPLPSQRNTPSIRTPPQSDPRERVDPEPRRYTKPAERGEAQRIEPVQRAEPVRRNAEPMRERSTPQRTQEPRSVQQPQREIQPRGVPQPQQREAQSRVAPQRQPPEMQPRSMPPSQQQQPVQRAPVRGQPNPEPRKAKRDDDKNDDSKDDGNERKRRE